MNTNNDIVWINNDKYLWRQGELVVNNILTSSPNDKITKRKKVKIFDFNDYNFILNTMLNHFIILGGSYNINIKDWHSSDDTILILATAHALLLNDSIENKYIKKYIESYDILNDENRLSGMNTLFMINLLTQAYE